jgi:hypothetical protein
MAEPQFRLQYVHYTPPPDHVPAANLIVGKAYLVIDYDESDRPYIRINDEAGSTGWYPAALFSPVATAVFAPVVEPTPASLFAEGGESCKN